MNLFEQFQVFLGSIFLGMLFLCVWTFFNMLFYKYKKSLIRLPFETILFCLFAYCYYLFLVTIVDGKLNIFYPLFLLLGAVIYQKVYAPFVNKFFNKIIEKGQILKNRLLNKIKRFYNRKKAKRRKQTNDKKSA